MMTAAMPCRSMHDRKAGSDLQDTANDRGFSQRAAGDIGLRANLGPIEVMTASSMTTRDGLME
jgi:hypothetical protein